MHMSDALISPAVGGALWIGSAIAVTHAVRTLRHDADDRRIPLMGVTGAFLFAAQMVNIAIPGTGSSGHLAGGLLLAALVGPHAALLVMASVLAIQALLFADGGLLAFGCNLFNLGVIPAYIVYPLLYRPLMKLESISYPKRLVLAVIPSALLALQLGACAVVLETVLSRVSGIPFIPFLLLMQPIHLAIGLFEAALTAGILVSLYRLQPELYSVKVADISAASTRAFLKLCGGLLVCAALVAGLVTWYASKRPDGLMWSLEKLPGYTETVTFSSPLHRVSSSLQSLSAVFPDYGFNYGTGTTDKLTGQPAAVRKNAETSVTALVGLLATLVIAVAAGISARLFSARQ